MTASERIEQMTHTWYGFTVFAAAASVIQVALWPFTPGLLFSPVRLALAFVGAAFGVVLSIALNLVCAAIGLLVAHLIGRALLARSSLMRLVLLVLSPLFAVFGAISALQLTWAGTSHFSLSTLIGAAVTAIAVTLYVRSFQLLRDPSIKAYVG
jgi:hypothetical protein